MLHSKMELQFAIFSHQIQIARQSKEEKLTFLFKMENLKFMFQKGVQNKNLKVLFLFRFKLIKNLIQFIEKIKLYQILTNL